MRRIVVILLLVFAFISDFAMADDEVVKRYADACLKMQRAIAERNKDMLTQAMIDMDDVGIDYIDETAVVADNSETECKSKILFIPEYADKLLLNDFNLASLDDVTILRSLNSASGVSAICRAVSGNTSCTYTLEGEGNMSLFMLPIDPGLKLKVYDLTIESGKEMPVTTGSDGISWCSWKMEPAGSFKLELINSSDHSSSFVIGIN